MDAPPPTLLAPRTNVSSSTACPRLASMDTVARAVPVAAEVLRYSGRELRVRSLGQTDTLGLAKVEFENTRGVSSRIRPTTCTARVTCSRDVRPRWAPCWQAHTPWRHTPWKYKFDDGFRSLVEGGLFQQWVKEEMTQLNDFCFQRGKYEINPGRKGGGGVGSAPRASSETPRPASHPAQPPGRLLLLGIVFPDTLDISLKKRPLMKPKQFFVFGPQNKSVHPNFPGIFWVGRHPSCARHHKGPGAVRPLLLLHPTWKKQCHHTLLPPEAILVTPP
ncbi:hypothetical protein GWK47_040323 [Chionoecetes opilio]|uniref:Uncharacterized protein n=1 Tax=Chionoecetes opilio TaxID=41210 RepID=A0A8J4YIP2_CHIOP|nr:hypothetical protein GWK47_040323 [Chionoecetes opilio]